MKIKQTNLQEIYLLATVKVPLRGKILFKIPKDLKNIPANTRAKRDIKPKNTPTNCLYQTSTLI